MIYRQTAIGSVRKLNGSEPGELVSVATNSGIDGNYPLGDRDPTVGRLDWANTALAGKRIFDQRPTIIATAA